MKQTWTFIAMLMACTAPTQLAAQTSDGPTAYTVVKQNPITSIKNQHLSGTCWDYATIGFVEAELLRLSGKTYDLSEMFVAYNDYVDEADYHVRMKGYSRFDQGGSADDVFAVIQRYGICPETEMARPGMLVGDSLANFTELFRVLVPYVHSIADATKKNLSPQWKKGLRGILSAYLGDTPATFTYEGKIYTPLAFAQSLGIDWTNYASLTSFTHHPFYENFVIEASYKWRPRPSLNLPVDEWVQTLDNALLSGYTAVWGGDTSGNGFLRSGTAFAPDTTATQELRQQHFDSRQSTYDHVMLIYGLARAADGRKLYLVKNSWGLSGQQQGIWLMDEAYLRLYTTYVFVCRDALPKKLRNLCAR